MFSAWLAWERVCGLAALRCPTALRLQLGTETVRTSDTTPQHTQQTILQGAPGDI